MSVANTQRFWRVLQPLMSICLLTAMGISCSSSSDLAVSSLRELVPYNDFSEFHYYQLKDTQNIAIEFDYASSITSIKDIECKVLKSKSETVVRVRLLGGIGGSNSNKLAFNSANKLFSYIDVGTADMSKLRVVYEDEKIAYNIPYAGALSKPFAAYVPSALNPIDPFAPAAPDPFTTAPAAPSSDTSEK